MDPLGDLALLASHDPRVRFAAEDRLRAAGPTGVDALARLAAHDDVPEPLRSRAADLLGSLLHEGAVRTFRASVDPDAPDLWAGAVAIAAEGHPTLDAPALDRRLDALVDAARGAVPSDAPPEARARALTTWWSGERGFHGDAARSGDPRSSYLPDVLERRTGLPIALAVVWMTVARRLGLPSSGVGLPLHFVARCEGADGPVFVDAFHGAVLDEDGCRRLVSKAAGRDVTLPARAFRPLRPGEVLARMLRNLRALHEGAGRLHMALASVDRALHLDPLDVAALRERAFLLARLGRPGAAARALGRVLAVEPPADPRSPLDGVRRALLRAAAERN